MSHFGQGFVADNDEPGHHGRTKEADMDGGLERYMGHGRRWLGGDTCHLKGSLPQFEDKPGNHGGCRGEDFEGGLMRCCGHGLRKVERTHHCNRHHISDDVESEPGLHGHTRDLDYKDGMPFYIGNGKTKVPQLRGKDTWIEVMRSGGARRATYGDNWEHQPAGMTTRHIALSEMTREPSRRGTHQDRRHVMALEQGRDPHVPRRDQACSGIELCLPGAGFTGAL